MCIQTKRGGEEIAMCGPTNVVNTNINISVDCFKNIILNLKSAEVCELFKIQILSSFNWNPGVKSLKRCIWVLMQSIQIFKRVVLKFLLGSGLRDSILI